LLFDKHLAKTTGPGDQETIMQVQRIDNMFNFSFEKPATEIVEKAKNKAAVIRHKIEEREGRIKSVRTEYKISSEMLVDIMAQSREQTQRGAVAYNSKVRSDDGLTEEDVTIGAGVVNLLLTERDHIEGEKAQVEKLDMIARNLKDTRHFAPDGKAYMEGHTLTTIELKFLGF
jgi:hypothetical protein